jgi:hypothetical protein
MAMKSFRARYALNSCIAKNVNGWKSDFTTEYNDKGGTEKIAYWCTKDGVKIIRCDQYEPTENTDQAWDLLQEWELLHENRDFMIKAADSISEDELSLEDDYHCFARLQICLAVLACASFVCDRDFVTEYDYAY